MRYDRTATKIDEYYTTISQRYAEKCSGEPYRMHEIDLQGEELDKC